MAQNYRGTLQPLLQGVTDSSSPTNGFVRQLEYRGMSENHARALFNQYIGNGMEAELQVRFGICTLIATDTSGAVTIDTWEVGVNELLVPSLKNPRNLFEVSANDLLLLAYMNKNGGDLVSTAEALQAETGAALPAFSGSAWAQRLRDRLREGSDSYFHQQYVLRHTTNVSNRWGVNVADFGVNMIYSTADLLSETQNGSSWIYPLPGRLAYKLNLISSNHPAPPAFYFNGWLKSASSESTSGNNRVNIVTDYKFFTWSTDEYEVY